MNALSTLNHVEDWCWTQLARGAADPRSALHWPVVCTAGDAPSGRVMVLRGFDRAERRLDLFTDRRSPKVTDLTRNPLIECVFFDQRKGLQIRAAGTSVCHFDGDLRNNFLARIPDQRRGDYGTDPSPGSAIASPDDVTIDIAQADDNFCLLQVFITKLDWLHLDRSGHRRAQLAWSDGKPAHSWRAP